MFSRNILPLCSKSGISVHVQLAITPLYILLTNILTWYYLEFYIKDNQLYFYIWDNQSIIDLWVGLSINECERSFLNFTSNIRRIITS